MVGLWCGAEIHCRNGGLLRGEFQHAAILAGPFGQHDACNFILPRSDIFALMYILYAKRMNVPVYNTIIADTGLRKVYTYLSQFHAETMKEWKAVELHRRILTQTVPIGTGNLSTN